jgi:hypothetical protein
MGLSRESHLFYTPKLWHPAKDEKNAFRLQPEMAREINDSVLKKIGSFVSDKDGY